MEAAIAAHGGRERLARFDNVKVIGHARFKGRLELTGTASFVAPATWAVEGRLHEHPAMQFGMDGERCWRRDRQFVRDCSAGDDREYRRFGEVLRLRFLHGLESRPLVAAGERAVGAIRAPAVRLENLILAFDPLSHRLVEVSSGDWVETYSDFRVVDGAVVSAARTLFIGGALDVEETWDDILPGQADAALLHPPPPAQDGDTLDDVDAERWVATARIEDLDAELAGAVRSLDEFAAAQGQKVSASDGVVLTELPRERPGQAQQWEVSIGLEPTTAGLPQTTGAPFRFERWPESRFVGVFHRGDPRASEDKQTVLRKRMERAGVGPAPGSRWQFVCTQESLAEPLASRLYLLRLAVVPAGPLR